MEGRMRAVETTEPSQNQERSRPGQWEPNRVMLRLNRSVIHRNWSGEICRPAMQYINKNNLHNNKRDVFILNLVNDRYTKLQGSVPLVPYLPIFSNKYWRYQEEIRCSKRNIGNIRRKKFKIENLQNSLKLKLFKNLPGIPVLDTSDTTPQRYRYFRRATASTSVAQV